MELEVLSEKLGPQKEALQKRVQACKSVLTGLRQQHSSAATSSSVCHHERVSRTLQQLMMYSAEKLH
jgi:hypothetical protein